jgi:hypothetical protein
MMGKRQLRELEDGLSATSGLLPTGSIDKYRFFDGLHPLLIKEYQAARDDVATFGLTELVETAIRDCLVLVRVGRRTEAQDLLINACRALQEKSGRMDEYRRMYTSSNDPSAS